VEGTQPVNGLQRLMPDRTRPRRETRRSSLSAERPTGDRNNFRQLHLGMPREETEHILTEATVPVVQHGGSTMERDQLIGEKDGPRWSGSTTTRTSTAQ
jgi:hypothetical protein